MFCTIKYEIIFAIKIYEENLARMGDCAILREVILSDIKTLRNEEIRYSLVYNFELAHQIPL